MKQLQLLKLKRAHFQNYAAKFFRIFCVQQSRRFRANSSKRGFTSKQSNLQQETHSWCVQVLCNQIKHWSTIIHYTFLSLK